MLLEVYYHPMDASVELKAPGVSQYIKTEVLEQSPLFDTLPRTGQSFQLHLVEQTLVDMPPVLAMDIITKVLLANFDWPAYNKPLLVWINEAEYANEILFLALYLASEKIRVQIYSNIGRVLQRKLEEYDPQAPVPPRMVTVIERLLDQNHCLSFDSPRDLAFLVRCLIGRGTFAQRKLVKNLQHTLGLEKAIHLLVRTCERLAADQLNPRPPNTTSKKRNHGESINS